MSNLQDWWPGSVQVRHPSAKYYIVTSEGDPEIYERYIYTLRWINPRPEVKLRGIRLESDPEQSATLAVLAITVARSLTNLSSPSE
jgi:hypothetical protein